MGGGGVLGPLEDRMPAPNLESPGLEQKALSVGSSSPTFVRCLSASTSH